MPQVSADTQVPVPPEVAEAVLEVVPRRRLPALPLVRDLRTSWRVRRAGDGSLVVCVMSYAAGLGWARHVTHEPLQWAMRRRAARLVADLAEACRTPEVVRSAEARAHGGAAT